MDKRIIYLKNKKNRGQFFSRNKGVLNSKGEYIIIIDPDDLSLIKSYRYAKKYKLDIVQFYHLMGDYKRNNLVIINKSSGIVFQQDTNKIFFQYDTRYLWDKLVRRNIFIKSIYFMNQNFKYERFIIHNDDTACFGLFKSAYSYGQIKEVGYFYSTTKKNFLPENINGRFHSLFATMDYYYEQSENNTFEKTKGGYHFFEYRIVRRYESKIYHLSKGFKYIYKVLDKYINSIFINSSQKNKLKSFKNKIHSQQENHRKHIYKTIIK